jgi:hypothetical protein
VPHALLERNRATAIGVCELSFGSGRSTGRFGRVVGTADATAGDDGLGDLRVSGGLVSVLFRGRHVRHEIDRTISLFVRGCVQAVGKIGVFDFVNILRPTMPWAGEQRRGGGWPTNPDPLSFGQRLALS